MKLLLFDGNKNYKIEMKEMKIVLIFLFCNEKLSNDDVVELNNDYLSIR